LPIGSNLVGEEKYTKLYTFERLIFLKQFTTLSMASLGDYLECLDKRMLKYLVC
jgi:hypothetical protein